MPPPGTCAHMHACTDGQVEKDASLTHGMGAGGMIMCCLLLLMHYTKFSTASSIFSKPSHLLIL